MSPIKPEDGKDRAALNDDCISVGGFFRIRCIDGDAEHALGDE